MIIHIFKVQKHKMYYRVCTENNSTLNHVINCICWGARWICLCNTWYKYGVRISQGVMADEVKGK